MKMNQSNSLQFVTDETGKKQAVLIPIQEWEKLQQELQFLREYQKMRDTLVESFAQIQQIRRGDLPKTSLRSFLKDG